MAKVDGLSAKCLVLDFHKTISGGKIASANTSFFTWGALDFLSVEIFESLSDYHTQIEQNRNSKKNPSSVIEEHRLFLYTDFETSDKGETDISQIFKPSTAYPLILITLLESNQLSQIRSLVEKISSLGFYSYQMFKTLGQDTCAVVFRCYNYKYALDAIVAINQFCENTYSIAGVQKDPSQRRGIRAQRSYFIEKRKQIEGVNSDLDCCVSIHYRLREIKKIENRVKNATVILTEVIDRFRNKNPLSKNKVRTSLFYEIGYYDIEVVLDGDIFYMLEILLNPDYGLANEESNFYKNNVFESRTVWKSSIKAIE